MIEYKPEGITKADNSKLSLEKLTESYNSGSIIEVRAYRCDENLNLMVRLGNGLEGIIPYGESEVCKNGEIKKIAIISKVGKTMKVCVNDIDTSTRGKVLIRMSRKTAQEKYLEWLGEQDTDGMIVEGKVINSEPFGAFLDIGCGVIALLPSENISVARVNNARTAFKSGEIIKVVIKTMEGTKITVSHKELLGTWRENVEYYGFKVGETVVGKARTITNYGIFIELSSNLSGLSEPNDEVKEGDDVVVYIKSIIPEKQKIKLSVIGLAEQPNEAAKFKYFFEGDRLTDWSYDD